MIHASSRRQKMRFVLGMIEIAGVGFSLGIISAQGVTVLAIVALLATTSVSVATLFIFRHD